MTTKSKPSSKTIVNFPRLEAEENLPELAETAINIPHNLETEMALLGGLLLDNKVSDRVHEFLRPNHFVDPRHGKIYEVICGLIERGQLASPLTVATYLDKELEDSVEDWNPKEYVQQLAQSVATTIGVGDYSRIIYDLAMRRNLITIGQEMVHEVGQLSLDQSALDHIESTEQKLFNLAELGTANRQFVKVGSAIATAIEMAETAFRKDSHVTGITTGLTGLDKRLGGLHPSDLIVLAGRPSMGKTALATCIAYGAAKAYKEEIGSDGKSKVKEGGKVAFFSLEMSAEQLALRLLAEQTKISSDRIRRGDIKAEDFDKFVMASKNLSTLPLYIDDTPGLTISSLRTRARRLKRQHGLDFIVIDYLQLIQNNSKSHESRVQVVSEITRGLKILAKELNVPILALSQLSRSPEQREDKRPQLSDLRESGSIEQDADVVMFIFREEYYLAREQPQEGTEKHLQWQAQMEKVHNVAEVIVAKQRHGPIGTVKLYFDAMHTTFTDLQPANHLPEDRG